ncbi:hypothetical protein FF38_13938, partial [Lucilia cuprina]
LFLPLKVSKSHIMITVLLILIVNIQSFKAYTLNDPPPICSSYEMLIVNTKQCVSRCPIRCINEICFEDGECPCANSYITSFGDGLVCGKPCIPGCIQAGGYCAAPQRCVCTQKGSYFDPVSRKCQKYHIFKDRCGGRCLYGNCTHDGKCNCFEGFKYNDNLFGQLCSPVCKQDCGRRGYCFLPNMCACRKKHYHYQSDGQCHKDDDYIF